MTPEETAAYKLGEQRAYSRYEKEEKEEEYQKMNNEPNGFSASDVVTFGAMNNLGRGSGGYGGGGGAWGSGGYMGGGSLYTGNNVLAAEAHANGTAVNAGIINNRESIRDLGMDFENATRDRQVAEINKNISDAEFRAQDRQRDIERIINEHAKEAANCCCDAKLEAQKSSCETQKLIISENTATRELIQNNALKEAERELDRADRSNNSNSIIGAINSNANANTAAIVSAIRDLNVGRG